MKLSAASLPVCLALFAVACQRDSRPPTAPTATPAIQSQTIAGVVLDIVATPVSGASVEIVGASDHASTVTDDAGRFSLVFQRSASQSIAVRVTKSGFHTATISNPAAPQLQIRLVPVELFNLRAAYSITFEAAGCDAIPAGLRTRTYSLAVAPPHTASPAFTGALQDAAFYRGYDTLFIMIGATARVMVYSWAAFEAWLEDQPIFEQLTPSGYLALSGTAHVVPDGGGTLSGAFNGSFTYCTSSALHSTRSDWPPICTGSVVACESANHRLTLVPR